MIKRLKIQAGDKLIRGFIMKPPPFPQEQLEIYAADSAWAVEENLLAPIGAWAAAGIGADGLKLVEELVRIEVGKSNPKAIEAIEKEARRAEIHLLVRQAEVFQEAHRTGGNRAIPIVLMDGSMIGHAHSTGELWSNPYIIAVPKEEVAIPHGRGLLFPHLDPGELFLLEDPTHRSLCIWYYRTVFSVIKFETLEKHPDAPIDRIIASLGTYYSSPYGGLRPIELVDKLVKKRVTQMIGVERTRQLEQGKPVLPYRR